ncbi:methylated-DNA--[protein]-cysteine S-methyltransferase [Flavobacteriaceae bacterium]|nr:methylated-DNA--[protein]-cysteine S-methyltransferase [Flavobacteriaceae bacterium]MDB9927710.1 methylated-DNA--[protein]-cysteine S-methyltransferase [Flavobacteriaceae bacterium]
MESNSTYYKTPIGFAEIIGDKNGIQSIALLDNSTNDQGLEKFDLPQDIPECLQECALQLKEYFKGERTKFDLLLNPQGTSFQKLVWKELCNIPFGKTRSYLAQSKLIGDPKAVRAVASANGKNPIWIVVPCHRVIGSDGSLTGYAGGLWRKKWLLDHESPVKQQSLF